MENQDSDRPIATSQHSGGARLIEAKKRKKTILIVLSVISALFLVVGGVLLYNYNLSRNYWANVDGEKVSASLFNKIANAYKNQQSTQSQSGNVKSAPDYHQLAANQVFKHTVLAKEATKKNIDFGPKALNEFLQPEFNKLGGEKSFYEYYSNTYGWDKEVTDYIKTTDLLEEKTSKVLYQNKEFSGVTIRWDLVKTNPNIDKTAYENEVKEIMQSKVLPMFQKGDDKETIEKQTDSYKLNKGQLGSGSFYTGIKHPTIYNYFTGLTDKASYDKNFVNYENEGTTNYENMKDLKKVGDFTAVFKSSTGYYAIFRLEKITDGDYPSQEDMLAKYSKNTKYYSKYKYSQTKDYNQKVDINKTQSKASETINKNLGIQQAVAADANCLTDLHKTTFAITFEDADNPGAAVWGTSVHAESERASSICGTRNYSFTGTSQFPNSISGTWSSTPTTYHCNAANTFCGDYSIYKLDETLNFGSGPADVDCYGDDLYTWKANSLPDGWAYSSAQISTDGYKTWTDVNLSPTGSGYTVPRGSADNGAVLTYSFKIKLKKVGKIEVQKHYPAAQSDTDYTNIPALINSAEVKLYAKTNFGSSSYYFASSNDSSYVESKPNPFRRNSVAQSENYFKARVLIPTGYEVSNIRITDRQLDLTKSSTQWTIVTRDASCTIVTENGNNYCETPAFWVQQNETTPVKVWFRGAISTSSGGSLTCTKDTANNNYYWTGQAVDGTSQASTPRIDLKEVVGGVIQPTVVQTIYANVAENRAVTPPTWDSYAGLSANTKYGFKQLLDKRFFDNTKHTMQPYIVQSNGTNIALSQFSVGPNGTSCTDIPSYSFPWLQTRQGDVVSAQGNLVGQGFDLPKSRLSSAVTKESEFLVIAGANPAAGNNFCSDYYYILTNNNVRADSSCGNGTGYPSIKVDLGTDSADRVVNSTINKYNSLSNTCAQVKTDGAIPDVAPCLEGSIFKLNSSTLGAYTLNQGNVTIYRDGDLTITGNLDYSTSGYNGLNLDTLKNMPNLTIVVKGKVWIASNVTNVKATIYATNYINTCSTFTSDTSPLCTNTLAVKGSLVAKNGFIFARANPSNNNPAETISLYPMSLLYPSPVLNQSSIFGSDSATKIDYTEYQPRF